MALQRIQLPNRSDKQTMFRKVPTARELLAIEVSPCLFKPADINAVVNQRFPGDAVEFHARLFVGRHGSNQIRSRLGQIALGSENQGIGGRAEGIFLLLGIERLFGELYTCFGGIHTCAILLEGVLGVADFNSDLVFQLIQPHFCLAVLELRPNLVGLRSAIAEGNGQLDASAFIGGGAVEQIFQRTSVPGR